mgnify:CR=1 FL=1
MTEQAEPTTAISCKLDADWLLLYFYSRSRCLKSCHTGEGAANIRGSECTNERMLIARQPYAESANRVTLAFTNSNNMFLQRDLVVMKHGSIEGCCR